MSKLWRKVTIWGVVVAALITTCFLPYLTFAAGVTTDVITVPSTAGQLKEAAEIQLVVNTFKKCVDSAPAASGKYEYDGKEVYGVAKEKKDIFPDIFTNNAHTNIAAGAWLEYKVQNKVNNGTIYCDDSDSKILSLFADKLGLSTTSVACNVNAGNGFEVGQRGGLLKRVVLRYKPGNNQPYYDVSNSCAAGLSDSNSYYVWADNGWNYDTDASGTAEYLGGVDYVKFLYNRFKDGSDNPYLVEWDDLGNFTNPAMGYYLYLNDFYTSCGSSTVDPSTTNDRDMWTTPVSLIDENYGVSEKYYGKNVVKEDWDSSFVSRSTPHTCTAVINRINELVDGARSELIARKQAACDSASFDIADKNWLEAQEILNNEEMDEESKAKAQEVLDTINSYDGEFWTYTENGGIVCRPIPSVTGATTIVNEDPIVTPEPGPGEDPGITDGCFNSSGALGWIICPVMKIVGEAINGVYGIVEENYLSINSDIVESDGLTEAWKYFQTFANIIFVILLIIVILAQVTGFGISNYGIKKILPRLVITAILVNLSLIMCIIAADLSNIAGSGFNEMLRNIKVGTLTWQDINIGTFFLDTITSIGVVGTPIAIAGTAVAITIADGGWGVLIMPLLIGALVAFFAILFFYVLLAVRKAAIVLLIAISPIAVVCYVLPNTQRLFSRWLKMFSTLLLVYPICGILMGGGNFASRLLLVTAGDAGFVYYLVCMLLSVVPFFFIPTLLKNSMSVLGSIGSKIANMGSRWSNMATGALRRSRWAQDHQQEIARNIDMNRSKRLLARNQRTLDKLNRKRTNPADSRDLSGLSASERRRYQQATFRKARAAATQERRNREEIEAANIAEYYNDEMLQNQEASARRKYRENLVNSFADGTISSGRYSRSDGTTDAVDFNDPVDIERALANLAQDVENNPDDKLAMIRLESMMEIAKRKGAKGRRAIINAMRTTETSGSAFAAKSMAERLLLDDRTMGAFHSYDPGSESYAQDLAAGRATKSRSDYAMQTIDSMKLDNVGDLDDSFYDNLDELHKDIQSLPRTPSNVARLKTLEDSYRKAVNTMTQAASDPRYAGKIKSKDAQNIINKHAKQMYEIERDHWLNNAANLPQLTVTDASGATIQAAGIDGQGYLTNGTTRLVDASGNHVLATDAYSSQIKAYQDVALGQGNSAEIKIPRKRNVPYVFDNATGNYQAENDAYIHTRQQWMGNNANISQLSGYNTSGQLVNAAGVDNDGFLVDTAGGRLLNVAGGTALNANDAYDRQVVYANQRAAWLKGRQSNGKSNVSQLVGYDRNGTRVNATRARGGFLFDQNNNPLLDRPGGNALKATDAYDQQVNATTGRFRGLRPEEQRVLDKILDYNASVDLQQSQ